MTHHFASASGSNGCYFERTPEHLVLEGYRHWSAGYETGSIQPWEMARNIYETSLGFGESQKALSALSHYVRALKKCANCPLRAFPFHSQQLCIEECLTLGLIAGLQHGDDAVDFCLSHLACPSSCNEISEAAFLFSSTLREINQILLPIPKHVIEDVTTRQVAKQFH